MKNIQFSYSQCLRYAFMSGAGYSDLQKISDEDLARWSNWEPPMVGSFLRMEEALSAASHAGNLSDWVEAAEATLAPFLAIADAYDASNLDEVRPEWNVLEPGKVPLLEGRGGKTLLTLQHCFDAREACKVVRDGTIYADVSKRQFSDAENAAIDNDIVVKLNMSQEYGKLD